MADAPTVRFHRSLYPTASVLRAAERFAGFGASVQEEGPDVVVRFSTVADRLRDRLPDEFRNHALYQVVADARESR